MKRLFSLRPSTSALARALLCGAVLAATATAAIGQDLLGGLTRPQEGRSMRATSTRRGNGDRHDPKADPRGDRNEQSNFDNFRVGPGETHVLMDEKGPGVITHIWMTFLGPEPQEWAKAGSANHQDMLLRIYWDGSSRPGVEAPVGTSLPTRSASGAR